METGTTMSNLSWQCQIYCNKWVEDILIHPHQSYISWPFIDICIKVKTIVLVVYLISAMVSARVRFLRRSNSNWGTTKGNGLPCQDGENRSWWRSSSKYNGLKATEFGMGMRVGDEGWEWDMVEAEVRFCCTFLEGYDKELRFITAKGTHRDICSREVALDWCSV